MRKLIFLNRYFSPDESATSQLLTDLAFDLAAAGFSVEVVTSRQRYEDAMAPLVAKSRERGVLIHRLWTTRWGRETLTGRAIDYLTFYISAGIWLLTHVHHRDVIVAKTDPPLIGVVAALAARLRGARLINWLQDVYPEVAEQLKVGGVGLASRVLKRLRTRGLRSASMNIVIGRCMGEFLEKLGVDKSEVTVIPNWVDDVAIAPRPREAHALRHEWELDDVFVVGYSGNMGRVHEFERLIGAANLLGSDRSIRFLFIGSGARKNDLRDEAEELDLRNVVFKPYQPQERLGQSLTVPDVHVVTLQDSLGGLIVPSKFYGAIAAGRPVIFIGPPECEVARVIREWDCGFVWNEQDPRGLAVLIRELASDPARVAALGARARRATEASFGRIHALTSWRQVIERAAEASKAPMERSESSAETKTSSSPP
jgi:glycosyltransferase involved in cell wall biosynthesis